MVGPWVAHALPTRGPSRRAITRRCAGDLPPLELLRAVADQVHQAMPYAAAGWQIVDPATLIGTGGFAQNVDAATHRQCPSTPCATISRPSTPSWACAAGRS
jgi:hypothetical protein